MLFGGRKESFPQLRSPPRSGLLEYSVLYRFSLNVELCGFVSVPSESALAQPPSSFSYPSISQDFILDLSYCVGAHPLVMDALAEMSEAQIRIAHLTHPSHSRVHKTPLARTRGTRAGLPYLEYKALWKLKKTERILSTSPRDCSAFAIA